MLMALVVLYGLCGTDGAGIVDNEAAAEEGADAGQDVGGEDAETPEWFLNEDDVPDGLPPLEEEHGYFASIDLNKDGVLNPSEFQKHLQRVTALDLTENDIDDMYAKNLTLGMAVGKVWVELHGSDSHEAAFAEIDANGDKKLTWDEWIHEMFHDQPQEAVFVDGEDGDIFTEELMLSFDTNGDKYLDFDEARAFVGKHMRREDVDAEYTGKQAERDNKQGGMGMSYLFMIEFDRDHDNKVSIQEWNDGFQGQTEEVDSPGIGGVIE